MNKYLLKIAAKVASKQIPYRDRVEVLIMKDNKVLVTINKNKETGETWYGLPGGGLDGNSAEKAGREECLEEVGVDVKDLKSLNVEHTEEGGMSKKEDRHLKYRGSLTKWYQADYVKMDSSKLGNDNDSRKYSWKTHQEALQAFKEGKLMSVPRSNAVKALRASKAV